VSVSETHWGLWLHAVRPLPQLADLAANAEEMGAAAILVADEGTDRDIHVTLAALAQRTRSVMLVAAVSNPFSRHPVASAAAFASLAELAPGRIVAGFGAGGSRVFGPMGLQPARPFTALVDTIDIVSELLAGKVVDHDGAVKTTGAALPWTSGPLPIAIAGRGPRVQELAATRADWVLLAGKSRAGIAGLVDRLRSGGLAARGRPPLIAWNPLAAWTSPMIEEARSHLAYMTVDLPAADKGALGVDDELVARLRALVTSEGPEAAASLVPQSVVDAYAIAGSRSAVVAQLGALVATVRPELLVFDAGDYSVAFAADVGAVAVESGAVGLFP
jgi:5,10-methylenetetrahydromethanopterin reductase